MKTLVLSDLHLGSCNNSEKLWEFLKNQKFDRLILLGDIVDFWHKIKFTETELKILKRFLKLASQKVPVVWVVGNHDEQMELLINEEIANFEFCREKMLKFGDRKILFVHGDQFDRFVKTDMRFISHIGSFGYRILIRLNKIYKYLNKNARYSLSQAVKERTKKAADYINNFENCVKDYGVRQQCDTVICGHIHTAKIENDPMMGITYVNCGDWQEGSDYVVIEGDHVFLRRF